MLFLFFGKGQVEKQLRKYDYIWWCRICDSQDTGISFFLPNILFPINHLHAKMTRC